MKRFITCAAIAALAAAPVFAGSTTFNDRATFEAQLGTSVIDDYESPPYDPGFNIYNDVTMSAFVGETDYMTTGFSNLNIVTNGQYCAGCNGSFELGFTTTSVGNATGVFGAGFDLTNTDYFAFVTFGDGSTLDIDLAGQSFFGITSSELITSIHVGLTGGGTTTSGSIQIDNLTIGNAVPAPGALALLGMAGLAARRRRRA